MTQLPKETQKNGDTNKSAIGSAEIYLHAVHLGFLEGKQNSYYNAEIM